MAGPPALRSIVPEAADKNESMSMAASLHADLAPGGAADEGMRCPNCEYNLTGLPQPRCPECGVEFTWDEVRPLGPQIAFERTSGRRKLLGLLVTWLTVLFAPWVFARQVVRRASLAHALVFGLVCFAGAAGALVIDWEPGVMVAWWIVAGAFLLIETVVLTAVDVAHWKRPLRSLRFWLTVSCYTSAVMVTEVFGPPLVRLEEVWGLLSGQLSTTVTDDLYTLGWPAFVLWGQVIVWLAAVTWCYAARLHRAHWRGHTVAAATLLIPILLFVMYGAAVDSAIRLAIYLKLV